MKKLLKLTLWLGGGLVLLLVVGLLVAFMYMNSIARSAVERGGTWALGVPTTVSSVSVGWGDFGLKKLRVDNPAGYSSDPFLQLGSGDLNVSMKSLREPLVEVPRLELADLKVRLEKKEGKANYDVILENLAKVQSGKSSPPSPSGEEKKFVIRELVLKNVHVHYELFGSSTNGLANTLGKAGTFDIPVGDIRLTDVGRIGTGVRGTGVTISDLSGIVVQAVLAAASEKASGILPADLLGDLKGKLNVLKPLQELGIGGLDTLKSVGGDIQKAGEGAVDTIKKGIGGLFGGDEKKDADKKK